MEQSNKKQVQFLFFLFLSFKILPLFFYQALAYVGIVYFYQYNDPLTETLALLDFLEN